MVRSYREYHGYFRQWQEYASSHAEEIQEALEEAQKLLCLPEGCRVFALHELLNFRREELRPLSPLVIPGSDIHKTKWLAAYLAWVGNPEAPWHLVLRTHRDALKEAFDWVVAPYRRLEQYGWRVLVNRKPDGDTPRVYAFEEVDAFHPREPDQAEIENLAERWPVIVVPDSDGDVPGYLSEVQEAFHRLRNACLLRRLGYRDGWAVMKYSIRSSFESGS